MSMMERLNPTIFDKLVADLDIAGLREDSVVHEYSKSSMKNYNVPRLERFNESALREIIKRDIAWLLNTSHMASSTDLQSYPEVQTSVLNYGVPDLSGQVNIQRAVIERARDIRAAIRTFEPRIDEKSLRVEPTLDQYKQNCLTYVIHGDITAAVNSIPVVLKTDIEVDTASVTVRE
jgi:type VI secretion system protein ImpF